MGPHLTDCCPVHQWLEKIFHTLSRGFTTTVTGHHLLAKWTWYRSGWKPQRSENLQIDNITYSIPTNQQKIPVKFLKRSYSQLRSSLWLFQGILPLVHNLQIPVLQRWLVGTGISSQKGRDSRQTPDGVPFEFRLRDLAPWSLPLPPVVLSVSPLLLPGTRPLWDLVWHYRCPVQSPVYHTVRCVCD